MKRDEESAGPSNCPSRQDLADFSTGKMANVATDAIAAHIGRCGDCQGILDELGQDDDSLVGQLRDADRDLAVSEAELARVVARIELVQGSDCDDASPPEAMPDTDAPTLDSRLQIRCPFCHELSSVSEPIGAGTMVCSKCGGQFGLIMDEADDDEAGPGTRIAHFELLERLGGGSFGTVWKAWDAVLQRMVALKLPRKERFREGHVENLLHEARVLAQIRHPGIVSVYEIGVEDNTVFMANELVDGSSLETLLSQQRYSVGEAARLCLAVAEALDAAHRAGAVHRDLKPSNILLDRAGTPRIADFGLAIHAAIDVVVSVEGHIFGTPVYMSPEQARGSVTEVDQRSDIYSLGVILYRVLTGRPPFEGDIHVLVARILVEPPLRPRALNESLPRDLETICLKCLEKKASQRYQSATELATDLGLFLDGKPIHARPVSQLGRFWRAARRRPALATVSTIAVLLLASTIAALGIGRWKTMAALNNAQRNLYFNSIGAAQQKWLANDGYVANEVLDECPPEFRDFEWGFLKRVVRAPLRRLHNAGGVLAYHPDGARLATSGGSEPFLKIWDTRTDQRIHRLTGHTDSLLAIQYNVAGTKIVSAGRRDGTVRIWDAVNGLRLHVLRGATQPVQYCTFSLDGTKVASFDDGSNLRVWDVASRRMLSEKRFAVRRVRAVAFSPATHHFAVASRRGAHAELSIYDYETNELVTKIPTFQATTGSLAYSPDGKRLAVGEVRRAIRIWQLDPTVKLLATIAGPVGEKSSVVFDATGQRVAAEALDGTICVWGLERGQTLLTLRGHRRPVYDLVFSPDGTELAAGVGRNEVCIWDVTTEQGSIAFTGGSTSVQTLAVSPDGDLLAAGFNNGVVKVWERATGEVVWSIDDSGKAVRSLTFSSDGCELAIATDSPDLRVYAAKDGTLMRCFTGRAKPLRCVAYSPDGTLMALAGLGGVIELRDVVTGQVRHSFRMMGPSIRSVAFHPDGKRIAAGGARGIVTVFDIDSGAALWTKTGKLASRIWNVAFSPDGSLLATSRGDGTIHLRNAKRGSLVRTFGDLGIGFPVTLAFSPDGHRLVTATARTAISLWEPLSGRHVLSISRNPTGSGAVAFAPDGQAIVTGDIHGTVQMWPTIQYHQVR